MYAETLRVRDDEASVYVFVNEVSTYDIHGADGSSVESGTLQPGDYTMVLSPGEYIQVKAVSSNDYMMYRPSMATDREISAEDLRRADAIRAAVLEERPGMHIGL